MNKKKGNFNKCINLYEQEQVWMVNSKYEIYKGGNIKNTSGGVHIIKYIERWE